MPPTTKTHGLLQPEGVDNAEGDACRKSFQQFKAPVMVCRNTAIAIMAAFSKAVSV
jgi:hypothetical protein